MDHVLDANSERLINTLVQWEIFSSFPGQAGLSPLTRTV